MRIWILLALSCVWCGTAFAADPLEVKLFEGQELSFGEAFEEITVTLPPDGNWTSIVLKSAYEAGIGSLQDPWDRIASMRMLMPGGEEIEISRDITDYGFTTVHARNLTRFARLLTGDVTFRIYLTPWTGGVWRVRSILTFYSEGQAVEIADYTFPVHTERSFGNPGNPNGPYSTHVGKVTFPDDLVRLQLIAYATGHTQEEEFGPRRTLTWAIDGITVGSASPWATNCAHCDNHGTTFNRSGWCPGMNVNSVILTTYDPAILAPGDHNVTLSFNGLKNGWEVSTTLNGFKTGGATPTPVPTDTPAVTATPTPSSTPFPTSTPTPTFPPPTMPPPRVALAGYMNTNINIGSPGNILLWVYAGLPGTLPVEDVGLFYEGIDTSFDLDQLSPEVYQLFLPIGPSDFRDPAKLRLELVPRVSNGTPGETWPFLNVKTGEQ